MSHAVLISVKEVSSMLGMSERTVWRLANAGKMPAALRVGGARRWRRADILSWIDGGCKPIKA